MAVITSAGNWTPLNVDWSKTPKTGQNLPWALFMQLEQLKNADLPELTQFVQAMADGYGVPFHVAKEVFFHCVTAMRQRETPSASRSYAA